MWVSLLLYKLQGSYVTSQTAPSLPLPTLLRRPHYSSLKAHVRTGFGSQTDGERSLEIKSQSRRGKLCKHETHECFWPSLQTSSHSRT